MLVTTMGDTGATSILLVDDDPSVLAMLRAVLKADGYAVTTAISASDARDKLATAAFDVVITDMRMETETAGFDVIRAARAQSPKPAIIVLTAFTIHEQEWRNAAADACFTKPVVIADLLSAVARLLEERTAPR